MESFHPNADSDDIDMDESSAEQTYVPGRITLEQYEKQAREFTKQQLSRLLASPEYQRRLHTCGTCWSPWLDRVCRDDCMECGGFPLERSCPVCKGSCGRVWKRDVETSHSNHEAHWEGVCALPWEQQRLHLQLILNEDLTDENSILDAMQSLVVRQTSIETEDSTPVPFTHWCEHNEAHQRQTPRTFSNPEQIVGNDFGHWCQESDTEINSTHAQQSNDSDMQL